MVILLARRSEKCSRSLKRRLVALWVVIAHTTLCWSGVGWVAGTHAFQLQRPLQRAVDVSTGARSCGGIATQTWSSSSVSSRWRLYAEWDEKGRLDSNSWRSSDEDTADADGETDWQILLQQKRDGSFWSSFEPSNQEDAPAATAASKMILDEDREADVWLNTIASLSAEEVEFNLKEADRADTARQMEEWGFDRATIYNTLGVAVKEENKDEPVGMQTYREQSFLEDVDLETVESHKMIELDEDGEPVRSQMVYVDEHTCIGCTNCAMIAQSTFFMHSEHGRARVFNQVRK